MSKKLRDYVPKCCCCHKKKTNGETNIKQYIHTEKKSRYSFGNLKLHLLILAYACVTFSVFSGLPFFETSKFFRLGPSEDLHILFIIDTWLKYGLVLLFVITGEIIETIVNIRVIDIKVNKLYDDKTQVITGYYKLELVAISNIYSFTSKWANVFDMIIAMTQIDIVSITIFTNIATQIIVELAYANGKKFVRNPKDQEDTIFTSNEIMFNDEEIEMDDKEL